jgi:hypothetical protein
MLKLSHVGLLLTLLLLINNSYYIRVILFNPDNRMYINGKCLCTGTDFVTSADPECCIINYHQKFNKINNVSYCCSVKNYIYAGITNFIF